ncbi:hypothetical protein [Sorangium atrum]|uniref:PGRS family protein n=1 Tax=Sorangium atrum TaxID=2995308 RepID=A0ABT5CG68_9BACT|nr:hypothetical protein [Sorangium aterium]MDC0685415.1 hypothetical protein [Sorangium aterium]
MHSRSVGRGPGVLRALASVVLGLAGAAGNTGCYSDSCAESYLCEPEPSPCDGDPTTATALDMCGVFVSEQGDDNGPGTKDAPVRTLQRAIGLAAHVRRNGQAPTRRVYACGGLFEEAISLPQGVDLWGGRLCVGGDWSYGGPLDGPNPLTVIAPPVGIPVRVLGGDDAVVAGDDATSVIFGVRAVAADASANDGKSSIAMILEHGARAIVRGSEILAGDGKDGEPGEDAPRFRASAGEVGNDGVDACTANVTPGALPVVTVCDDGIESTGGQGGDGGLGTGSDGTSGLPQPIGTPNDRGSAGTSASSMPCTDGGRGAAGTSAERAAGAAGAGLLDMDGWIGVRGEDGKPGGVGQGGGGGGGGKGHDPMRDPMNACAAGRPQGGASGGSGGSGGCGGKGGKGGDYGGASIAVVALKGSDLTVDASTVLGAKGGNGGVGGTGQWGGLGADGGRRGRGAATETSRGCDGGFGGDGGRGGDAGGGLGGHSLGIGSVGASVAILERATVSPGQAGKGGPGGNASAESTYGTGGNGIQQFWYRFDEQDPEPPR